MEQKPLESSVFESLGRVTFYFSKLEMCLAWGIWILLLPADQIIGQIVTAELSFKAMCALFTSLLREKVKENVNSQEIIDSFNSLFRKLTEAENKRNRVIHSYWQIVEVEGTASLTRIKITAKQMKGLNFQYDVTNTSELESLADEIDQLSNDFVALVKKHFPEAA